MRVGLKPLKELGAVQVKLKSIFALKPIVEEEIEEIPIDEPASYVFIIYTGWRWNPGYQEYYGIIKFNKSDWSIDNNLEVTNYLISEYAHCIIRDDRLYIAPVRNIDYENSILKKGVLVINTKTNEVDKWIENDMFNNYLNDMVVDNKIMYLLYDTTLGVVNTNTQSVTIVEMQAETRSISEDSQYIWVSTFTGLQKRNKSDLSLQSYYTLFSEDHGISRIVADDVYVYGLYTDYIEDKQGLFRFNKETQDKTTTYLPVGYNYVYYHFTLGNDNNLYVYCIDTDSNGLVLVYSKQLELLKTLNVWQQNGHDKYFNLESMAENDTGFWSGHVYNYNNDNYNIFRYNNDGEIINTYEGTDWIYAAVVNDYDKSKAVCMYIVPV